MAGKNTPTPLDSDSRATASPLRQAAKYTEDRKLDGLRKKVNLSPYHAFAVEVFLSKCVDVSRLRPNDLLGEIKQHLREGGRQPELYPSQLLRILEKKKVNSKKTLSPNAALSLEEKAVVNGRTQRRLRSDFLEFQQQQLRTSCDSVTGDDDLEDRAKTLNLNS
ncbi:hypothetical protein Efla_005242 [Eimeria flavescens]